MWLDAACAEPIAAETEGLFFLQMSFNEKTRLFRLYFTQESPTLCLKHLLVPCFRIEDNVSLSWVSEHLVLFLTMTANWKKKALHLILG